MTDQERLARDVTVRLRKAGHTVYFAGGCVRDKLLGREPQDYDIATDATAEEVCRLFEKTIPVGIHFGVVLVVIGNFRFEVATFRSDCVYLDGRRPSAVRFSTAEEDAQRRDFTINGMFLDPASGEIVDYVGGRKDLDKSLVRAIGSAEDRIAEDRLRTLRAIRFASRFGFEIEEQTLAAIRRAAPSVPDIAWERIGDEIIAMLTNAEGKRVRRAFELLDETTLLEVLLPEVAALKGVEQSSDYHPEGDVFIHTLILLENLRAPTETLALAALLHDIAKPVCQGRKGDRITFYGHCERGEEMAVEICQRLKRSRPTWERVRYLVKNHLRPIDAQKMRVSTLKRFLAEEGIEELLELLRLDSLASTKDLDSYEFCRTKLVEFSAETLRPKPLISGRDLIDLGLQPGPRFRELLGEVSDAQLEDVLSTRDQAIAWIKERLAGRSSV